MPRSLALNPAALIGPPGQSIQGVPGQPGLSQATQGRFGSIGSGVTDELLPFGDYRTNTAPYTGWMTTDDQPLKAGRRYKGIAWQVLEPFLISGGPTVQIHIGLSVSGTIIDPDYFTPGVGNGLGFRADGNAADPNYPSGSSQSFGVAPFVQDVDADIVVSFTDRSGPPQAIAFPTSGILGLSIFEEGVSA